MTEKVTERESNQNYLSKFFKRSRHQYLFKCRILLSGSVYRDFKLMRLGEIVIFYKNVYTIL